MILLRSEKRFDEVKRRMEMLGDGDGGELAAIGRRPDIFWEKTRDDNVG